MKKAAPLLIAANLGAYAVLAKLSGTTKIDRYYVDIFGMSKEVLINQRYYWQFLTSFFLHFNITHLSYNMVFLAIFGYAAEKIYGWRKMLTIYLLSGICVSFAAFIFYQNAVFGGASGAVLGLVGALLAAQKSKLGVIILVLIFLSATVSQVYIAHLVGLASGFLISRLISPERENT